MTEDTRGIAYFAHHLVDPYKLVMLGDLTDVNGFVEKQLERLGVRIERKDVQHLVNRRATNGCPNPLLPLRAAHIYQLSELQEWFDSYVMCHPKFMGGRLMESVLKARLREKQETGSADNR